MLMLINGSLDPAPSFTVTLDAAAEGEVIFFDEEGKRHTLQNEAVWKDGAGTTLIVPPMEPWSHMVLIGGSACI